MVSCRGIEGSTIFVDFFLDVFFETGATSSSPGSTKLAGTANGTTLEAIGAKPKGSKLAAHHIITCANGSANAAPTNKSGRLTLLSSFLVRCEELRELRRWEDPSDRLERLEDPSLPELLSLELELLLLLVTFSGAFEDAGVMFSTEASVPGFVSAG